MSEVEQFSRREGYEPMKNYVSLGADLARNPHLEWQIATLGNGRTAQHFVGNGARYLFFQVDYIDREDIASIRAKRMIAVIEPGERTELAYWKPEAPTKQLTVHQGAGQLLMASTVSRAVQSQELCASRRPEVQLPADNFYAFVANKGSSEALIVSGYYEAPFQAWDELEVDFPPDAQEITVDGKAIAIPSAFSQIFRS